MRIIGGEYRSRLIQIPKGGRTRPTKDRVREAVFNILVRKVGGSLVLDLYAGSGAMGIEAISRGARRAVFVEDDPRSVKAISDNIKTLGIPADKAVIVKKDATKAIRAMAEDGLIFDIIFLDPPYYKKLAKECLINIIQYGIVNSQSLIVVEHHRTDDVTVSDSGFIEKVKRRYGDTHISIFGVQRPQPALPQG